MEQCKSYQEAPSGPTSYTCIYKRRDHVTPLLWDHLYWLWAPERITFKLCLLMYNAMNGLALSYLQELCVSVSSVTTRVALYTLRSPWWSCGITDKTTTWHAVILCHRSCRLEQSMDRHSNCVDTCKLQTLNSILRHEYRVLICLFNRILCIVMWQKCAKPWQGIIGLIRA